jgi:hypothetical protein
VALPSGLIASVVADRFLRPVCGYPSLSEPPWSNNDSPSDEICSSCGTHFGNDDAAGGEVSASRESVCRRRRETWKSAGCRWFSPGQRPPPAWIPEEQLEAVET